MNFLGSTGMAAFEGTPETIRIMRVQMRGICERKQIAFY
jgi:hypothetical protein